ncbi:hypothetical protein CJF31_00006542 [Rutstroemia sp. NJR-2017a BVV2]|nr:hypothetical protein CJF31_00006542 [Rutstroemia sp. NJR-2017a BVV2]
MQPQDDSDESVAKRVGYCARVADYEEHSLSTRLALQKSKIQTKTFKVETRSFHVALVDAVLGGFVTLPPSAYITLEKSLLLRLRLDPKPRITSSIIRTSLFEITEEMVDVQRQKSSSTHVDVAISYNEYEAQFNMNDWERVSDVIDEYKKKQMGEYVNNDTIEVPF